MCREQRRIWFPMIRLVVFFVGIVILGNVLLQVLRVSSVPVPPESGGSEGSFPGTMKRLERRVLRFLERVIETPAAACSTEQETPGARVAAPVESRLSMSRAARSLLPGPVIEDLVIPEIQGVPFAWPLLMTLTAGPDFSRSMAPGFLEGPDFRAALVTDLYRRCGWDPMADVGDVFLEGPLKLFDGFFSCMNRLSGRPAVRTWEDEEGRSVTEGLLNFQSGPRQERIFTVFMKLWTQRESKYLSAFDESRADTVGFQNGTEGPDLGELAIDQRKIFWDVLRRTYLAQYKMGSEESVREEAWYFTRWSGLDYAVLPPLIGAYLYYRGLDKKIRIGETALRFTFEPISEFVHRNRDRSVATALEWTIAGFPVGIIVSAGLYDGRYGMDFVGIGTSVAAVRGAVDLQHGPPRPQ
jgi:hypothetical protein